MNRGCSRNSLIRYKRKDRSLTWLLPQLRLTGMNQVKEEEGDEAMEEGGD